MAKDRKISHKNKFWEGIKNIDHSYVAGTNIKAGTMEKENDNFLRSGIVPQI